jgi:hypothetical protein
MSIAYEYAACLLVVLCSGTLLFTLTAMGVLLWTASYTIWRRSRELAGVHDQLLARWTAEVRLP